MPPSPLLSIAPLVPFTFLFYYAIYSFSHLPISHQLIHLNQCISTPPTWLASLLPHHHPSLSHHRSQSLHYVPHFHCGQKACEISHRVKQHEFPSTTLGNGLVSETLISSQHYGKEMAVR